MLYSIYFILSVWIFGIAETGIARGSPPGTTTEVQRVGFPSAEIRSVSQSLLENAAEQVTREGLRQHRSDRSRPDHPD
jgi:hypothetical protein